MSMKKKFLAALLASIAFSPTYAGPTEAFAEKVVCALARPDVCEKVKVLTGGVDQRMEIGKEVIDLTKELLPNSPSLPRGPLLDAVIPVAIGGLSLALAEQITRAKIPPDCTKPAMVIAKDFVGKTAAPAVLVNYTYMAAVNAWAVVALEERRNCDQYRVELDQADFYRLTKKEIANLNLHYLKECMHPKDIAKVAEFTTYANGLVEKALGACHG